MQKSMGNNGEEMNQRKRWDSEGRGGGRVLRRRLKGQGEEEFGEKGKRVCRRGIRWWKWETE